MILSYHPIFQGDENRLCAGREPTESDRAAIRAADAVVLPQGCTRSLYAMARSNCRHVFPDYAARFRFPGKIGQIRLFQDLGVRHPATRTYGCVNDFFDSGESDAPDFPFAFPLVLKLNWGGEGETVHLLADADACMRMLQRIRTHEASGRFGFMLQERIPTPPRSLRVVVIGDSIISYWREQADPETFHGNLASGGCIDRDSDPGLQKAARDDARRFCAGTGINLAGIDILFSTKDQPRVPLFLEINYFFGRRGLGGSENYYRRLTQEIEKWLTTLGLAGGKPHYD